jgi:hypothetical protein
MDMRSQRGAEDTLKQAVDQLLGERDPVTRVRQLDAFIQTAIPYLWAARRAALYKAKTDPPMPWPALAELLEVRENNLRTAIRRHCDDTGDAWPTRGSSSKPPPRNVMDLRGLSRT